MKKHFDNWRTFLNEFAGAPASLSMYGDPDAGRGRNTKDPKEDEEDKIVNEVMDYLLGISVG